MLILWKKFVSEIPLREFRFFCSILKNRHRLRKSKYEQTTLTKPYVFTFFFTKIQFVKIYIKINPSKTFFFRKSLTQIPYFLQYLTLFPWIFWSKYEKQNYTRLRSVHSATKRRIRPFEKKNYLWKLLLLNFVFPFIFPSYTFHLKIKQNFIHSLWNFNRIY